MNKLLGTLAASLLAVAPVANAVPIRWDLVDVVFDDGATASGFFHYDAELNRYSDYAISVTPGPVFDALAYDESSSFIGEVVVGETVTFVDENRRRYITLVFSPPLDTAVGTVSLHPSSFECDCGFPPDQIARNIIAGSVTISAVAEPSTLALLGLGLLCLGFTRRRRAN
jgi:hypothetical protein